MIMSKEVVNTIIFNTNDGEKFPVNYSVYHGLSDFEVWLTLPGNDGKTLEDYQAFLKPGLPDHVTQVIVETQYRFT